MRKIEKGKPLHCVETITGNNFTGTLHLSEDEIRVRLYSYSDAFHLESEEPVYLVAESGQVVSFHENIDGGQGTTGHYDGTVYHQAIIGNVAVVGSDRWTRADGVKRVSFAVKHTMGLLRHQKKMKAIGKEKFPSEETLTIFEGVANGMVLRAWYSATYGMEFDTPEEVWPTFEIEFNEPRSVHDFVVEVVNYVSFLSFCFGVKFKPHDIRIDRLSLSEVSAQVEARTYKGQHEVHYVWPETEIDVNDLWVGGSPVRAWDDEELSALCASLVAWMDRAESWRSSYILMVASFGFKTVVSAERLINACRWLEEVPNAGSKDALLQKDIESIVAAASAKAVEFGYRPEILERIATSIARIKEETAAQRFARLLGMVEEKFGKNVLPENAITHLRRAIQFRGRVAHGHFNPKSEEEFRAFTKSIRAVEALCYLLTALDLPISQQGKERIRANLLIRDYRQAYE